MRFLKIEQSQELAKDNVEIEEAKSLPVSDNNEAEIESDVKKELSGPNSSEEDMIWKSEIPMLPKEIEIDENGRVLSGEGKDLDSPYIPFPQEIEISEDGEILVTEKNYKYLSDNYCSGVRDNDNQNTTEIEDVDNKADKNTENTEDNNESNKDTPSENTNEKTELSEEEKRKKLQDFYDGTVGFDEVKEILAEYYAKAVNSNKPWTWADNIPGGENLTAGQKAKIREYACEKKMVPVAETYEKNGKTYADFSEHKVFECYLDKEDWKKTDPEQFSKCNEQLKKAIENDPELAKRFTPEQLEEIKNGKTPTGYTWHHSEKNGKMELVPTGVHNTTYHCGGRSEGNWADASRH